MDASLLILCFLCAGAGEVAIRDLEIFQALLPSQVAVGDDGSLFIADRDTCLIYQYGKDGRRMATFGGKGSGPGEFQSLETLQWVKGELFAFDPLLGRRLPRLSATGKVLQAVNAPGSWSSTLRMAKGNLVSSFHPEEGGKRTLALADDLLTVGPPPASRPTQILASNAEARFNPAKRMGESFVARDGSAAFLVPPDKLEIVKISCGNGQKRTIFQKTPLPVPFDEAWGRKAMLDLARQAPSSNRVADFPDFFPPYAHVQVTGMDVLAVWYWGPGGIWMPGEWIDLEGRPLTVPYNGIQLSQVLAPAGDGYWLQRFDPEAEKLELFLVAESDLPAFLAEKPHALPED